MKVIAKFKEGRSQCPGFEEGKEYLAYNLFECPPDSNLLYSYGKVIIGDDGDAINERDAKRVWNIEFEVVKQKDIAEPQPTGSAYPYG